MISWRLIKSRLQEVNYICIYNESIVFLALFLTRLIEMSEVYVWKLGYFLIETTVNFELFSNSQQNIKQNVLNKDNKYILDFQMLRKQN